MVVCVECGGGGQRPAVPGGIKNTGQVQVCVTVEVDGVRIGNVVYRRSACVEFALDCFADQVAAIVVRFGVRVSCLARSLRMALLCIIVLGKSSNTQAAENQYDPKIAKGCHIHVWKGFCQIGCKSTTWNSFFEAPKIIFQKKMGQAGVF